jgi:acetyl esterase/lipase
MNSQVQDLIAMMRAAVPPDAPRMWQLPVDEARRRGDAFFAMLNHGGPEMAECRDLTVPGRRGPIPARLYVPQGAGARLSPGLLYLHGGGFVIGSPAGVPVELHVYDDGLHAFLQFSMLDMCGDALAKVAAFARRAL